MISWHEAKSALIRDGSLWDVFVHRTSILDWDCVVGEIKNKNLRYEYKVSGNLLTLTTAFDIFDLEEDLLPSLFVWIDTVRFDTYFVKTEEIVFDVHPKDVYDQETLNRVADFMKLLGNTTQKEVGLSPDSLHDFPFVTYLPSGEQIRFSKPPSRTNPTSEF